MTYSTAAKAARMTAVRDLLNGGALQLLDAGGTVLAAATLDSPAGATPTGAVLTLAGFPKTATASAGTAASARTRTAAGGDVHTALSVGIPGSGAQVIVDNGAGTLVLAAGATVTFAASPTFTHAA